MSQTHKKTCATPCEDLVSSLVRTDRLHHMINTNTQSYPSRYISHTLKPHPAAASTIDQSDRLSITHLYASGADQLTWDQLQRGKDEQLTKQRAFLNPPGQARIHFPKSFSCQPASWDINYRVLRHDRREDYVKSIFIYMAQVHNNCYLMTRNMSRSRTTLFRVN